MGACVPKAADDEERRRMMTWMQTEVPRMRAENARLKASLVKHQALSANALDLLREQEHEILRLRAAVKGDDALVRGASAEIRNLWVLVHGQE